MQDVSRHIAHDNSGPPPNLTPGTYVECIMGNGDKAYGYVSDFDWQHDSDPVVAYLVLRFAPAAVH